MKKNISLICLFLLIISPNMLAQVYYMQNKFENISCKVLSNINEMGVNDNLLLIELEGKYFNALYQIDEEKFNLSGKKVAFFTGSLGKTKSSKKMYFMVERDRLRFNHSPNAGTLYIFDTVQKEKNGGYDAAIVYWSKKAIPINDVVRRLRGGKRN